MSTRQWCVSSTGEISRSRLFRLGKTGPLTSRCGCHRDVGVERWVELFDEHEAMVREFDRRDFAVANFSAQFADCKQHLFLARPTRRLKAQFSTFNCGIAKAIPAYEPRGACMRTYSALAACCPARLPNHFTTT